MSPKGYRFAYNECPNVNSYCYKSNYTTSKELKDMRSQSSSNKLPQELGIHPNNFTAPPSNANISPIKTPRLVNS